MGADSPEAPNGGTLADAVEAVHGALASRSPAAGVAAIASFEERLRSFEHPALDDVARDLATLRAALSAPSVDGGAVGRLLTELASKTEHALDGAGPAGQPLAHLSGLLAEAGEELAGGHQGGSAPHFRGNALEPARGQHPPEPDQDRGRASP